MSSKLFPLKVSKFSANCKMIYSIKFNEKPWAQYSVLVLGF